MATKAGTEKPLRRDAEENRQRLLAAAREVFAEQGLEATMDDVAERAGVGVGTAYRRFANKEELIDALFGERIGELAVIMERANAAEDPWQGIVTYLEETVALSAGDKGLREVMLSSPHGHDFVDAARERLEPQIETLLARAHGAGVLRPGIESTDLVMIVLMLAQISDYGHDRDDPPWRRFLTLALDGIRPTSAGALPGQALSPEEQADLLQGAAVTRRGR
ncbi:MAG TPA: helix-turn-helix domain-containing protein [Solirubrobacterales bacterium]|nr:helix-turn-helix domain-containing protein [Solirubrobacterales bacterium]